MKLSAPVYSLKRLAKDLSRKKSIPLHVALDRIALDEGFESWSLLASKLSAQGPANELFNRLKPGELVLLGARPGQGKTLLGLEIVVKAVKSGRTGWFFSLEWNTSDAFDHLRSIGENPSTIGESFRFDNSDQICADYVIDRLAAEPSGTVVVIDYLQLLDQRRDNPELAAQIAALRAFSREQGIAIVFLSQIDRSYDAATKPLPDLTDVRLPNPLDLGLFDSACFLNAGEVRVSSTS